MKNKLNSRVEFAAKTVEDHQRNAVPEVSRFRKQRASAHRLRKDLQDAREGFFPICVFMFAIETRTIPNNTVEINCDLDCRGVIT